MGESGGDGIDQDAERSELVSGRFDHAVERGLGGAVDGLAGANVCPAMEPMNTMDPPPASAMAWPPIRSARKACRRTTSNWSS
ncbi:hypothetical protein GCM10009608_52650 [Pseudonocardia alaniniphila]